MTCIAVLRKADGKLIMAGDRRISWGMMKQQVKAQSKIIKRNGLLIGGTGVGYVIDLVRAILIVRPLKKNENPLVYMNNIFLEEFKKLLLKKGFGKDNSLSIPKEWRTIIIVACKSNLFEVEVATTSDHLTTISVDEIEAPYAHGCGGYYAWGSLLTTEGMAMTEKDRLRKALEIAAKVSPGCDNNIDFVEE